MSSKQLRGVKSALGTVTDALIKAPPAPFYLSSQAKAEWKRIVPQLLNRRILTRADLAGVEAYISAVGICRQIEELRAGSIIVKVQFGICNRAAQIARQLAAEYGLTSTSRARIGQNPADDDSDNPLFGLTMATSPSALYIQAATRPFIGRSACWIEGGSQRVGSVS